MPYLSTMDLTVSFMSSKDWFDCADAAHIATNRSTSSMGSSTAEIINQLLSVINNLLISFIRINLVNADDFYHREKSYLNTVEDTDFFFTVKLMSTTPRLLKIYFYIK